VTTCEEIRERLAEQVLGTLDELDDLSVRRHLRGCAGCRRESVALGEGLATFSRAAHDLAPPPELKQRVISALAQEWEDVPVIERRPRMRVWLPAAAAVVAMVASLTWGLSQHRQATVAAANSSSYVRLLQTLGGTEFRVGTLHRSTSRPAEGSVVVYESSHDQSWVLVFLRAPGLVGQVTATLTAGDGRSVALWPMTLAADGAGSTWLVTATNLSSFDKLTVTAPDGSVLGTAQITTA
jgi:predicted anti-sigma-YlaC factor YlaD